MLEKKSTWYLRGGIQFLGVIILLYLITFLIDSEKTIEAAVFSGTLLIQILPILLLVFALMFITNLLITPRWVKAHLGKDSGAKGWLIASIGGILSVGSIYPWLVLLKDLKEKGMRPALTAVFLYNRGIKLPLLPMFIHYFGLTYTVLLASYMTVFSLLGGLLIEKLLSLGKHKNKLTSSQGLK